MDQFRIYVSEMCEICMKMIFCIAIQVEPATALPRDEILNMFHLPAVPLPRIETSSP